MHETMAKFGAPETIIRTYDHWCVMLRPAQPTLGSLVLCARRDVRAFGAMTREETAELSAATADIEAALKAVCAPEKMNYLMLMMVDPQVHFHVIPRYPGTRAALGFDFPDTGWPGPPDLKSAIALDAGQITRLRQTIVAAWPQD